MVPSSHTYARSSPISIGSILSSASTSARSCVIFSPALHTILSAITAIFPPCTEVLRPTFWSVDIDGRGRRSPVFFYQPEKPERIFIGEQKRRLTCKLFLKRFNVAFF